MNLVLIVFNLVLGFLAATLGMLAGLAGGVLIVPILIIIGIPVQEVIGSVQAALFFPTLIASIDGFKRREIAYKFAILFEISTVIGTWIGAYLTDIIPSFYLKLIFGFLAFMISFSILRHSKKKQKMETLGHKIPEKPSKLYLLIAKVNQKVPPHLTIKFSNKQEESLISLPLMVLFGIIIGTVAGMLGIAGGWLKTPLMILVYQFPIYNALSTALFMALITVSSGALAHWSLGHLNYELTIPLAIGLSFGSLIGLKVRYKMSSTQLTRAVGVVLAIIAIILIISTFQTKNF